MQSFNTLYPSIEKCFEYMSTFAMLDNIRAHSMQVARVAVALLEGLESSGKSKILPDRGLVVAGALLHDIAKTECIREGCRHADIGKKICEDLGYHQIADIVQQHVILHSFNETEYASGLFQARELVYYADKRVRHDQVVSLADRLEYIIDRYGKNDPRIIEGITINFGDCLKLEHYLFSYLDFPPHQVAERASRIDLME